MPVIEITSKEEFEKVIMDKINHDKKYIFCDFYAMWCGPCKRFAPILDKLSDEYNDNIHYIKINIESNSETQELAEKYNITSLPTFMVFETGSCVRSAIQRDSRCQLT